MWPTPTATERSGINPKTGKGAGLSKTVQMWPTPTTRDHKGGYLGGRMRNGKVSMDTLDVAVQYTDNQQKNGEAAEPSVGRVANGIPKRVDRLKGLGNAIVPQIAMQIGLCIKQVNEQNES